MADEEKLRKGRERAKAWREANPERSKVAILKCKAAKPEKYKALQEKWRIENKDGQLEYRKQWRSKNRKKSNEFSAAWRQRNKEFRKKVVNNWIKRNREKVNAAYARRRAAKVLAVPKWANHFFINEIYDLAKRRTALKTGGHDSWHVDHSVPLKSDLVCGLHVEHNLQVVPASINLSKNNRHWPEMP